MKPIRVRAWNLVKKEMIYNPIVCGNGFFKDEYVGINDFFNSKFPKAKLEIMQFTGLLDKDGRAIFEGDICEWQGQGNLVYGNRFAVSWNKKQARWFIGSWLNQIDMASVKIIGNVWENPELLNQGE